MEGEGYRLLHCGVSRRVRAFNGVIGIISFAGVRQNMIEIEWHPTCEAIINEMNAIAHIIHDDS